MVQTADRVKVSVNLTQQDVDRLKELANAQQTTVTAALRQAIATETFIYQAVSRGAKLLLQEQDKSIREIVLHYPQVVASAMPAAAS